MAFNTAQNLESTVVSDTRLVNVCLAALYGVFTLVAIVAPKLVKILSPKWSMVIGAIPYVLLVFVNVATPSYSLYLPAFIGVGAGAAILWTGQGVYLSRCALKEVAATGDNIDIVTSKFNGLFWTAFQFNGAVGLIISSVIFQTIPNFASAVKYMFLGFGVVGAAGILILSSVVSVGGTSSSAPSSSSSDRDLEDESAATTTSSKDNDNDSTVQLLSKEDVQEGSKSDDVSLVETLKLVYTSAAMRGLILIIFYNGASLGFQYATFALLYQTASDGTTTSPDGGLLPKSVAGYVAASFFLTNSIMSAVWGRIMPFLGRQLMFYVTFVTHAIYFALVIAMTYSSNPASPFGIAQDSWLAYLFIFALAAIFAIGDSVLESQLPAIVQSSSFFPLEKQRTAGVSNIRMWMSLGFFAQFGIGIIQPGNISLQAFILAPLMVVSHISLWYVDKFVQPIYVNDKSSLKSDSLHEKD
jgi:MFS family permease